MGRGMPSTHRVHTSYYRNGEVPDVLRAAAALASSFGAAEDHGDWRGRACDGRQQLLGSTL